jgi:hypothetical protein
MFIRYQNKYVGKHATVGVYHCAMWRAVALREFIIAYYVKNT